jgi:hypothetical protein
MIRLKEGVRTLVLHPKSLLTFGLGGARKRSKTVIRQ